MFFIVLALEKQGITDNLKNALNNTNTIFSYGTTSYLSCSLINNIPMSVLYSSISTDLGSIYSSIIGSNIGAFLTPIGALAGIMWLSILKKHDIKFNFLDFIKYGAIISLPTLAASLLGLLIIKEKSQIRLFFDYYLVSTSYNVSASIPSEILNLIP
jgi:arsenical pump membrane protein